ncbi:hypothetical protein HK096_004505, partial [Nowakowskiella sp. JEL0078]
MSSANAAVPQQQPPQPPQQQSWFSSFSGIIRTAVIAYLIINIFRQKPAPPASPDSPASSDPANPSRPAAPDLKSFTHLWPLGIQSHLSVYLSESDKINVAINSAPVWTESPLTFGDMTEKSKEISIPVTTNLANNGSFYAHVFLSREEDIKKANRDSIIHFTKLLTRYAPKRKDIKLKKLVGGSVEEKDVDQEVESEPVSVQPWVSYWWSNLTISVVPQVDALPTTLPPAVFPHFRSSTDGKHYLPFFYANDFWMMGEQLNPINDTLKSLDLTLRFQPLSSWQFQLYVQMDESFKAQSQMMGANDVDQFKSMLIETNPILLGITLIVSLLHSVFDFLAFKNG